jgi:hypothetical protein
MLTRNQNASLLKRIIDDIFCIEDTSRSPIVLALQYEGINGMLHLTLIREDEFDNFQYIDPDNSTIQTLNRGNRNLIRLMSKFILSIYQEKGRDLDYDEWLLMIDKEAFDRFRIFGTQLNQTNSSDPKNTTTSNAQITSFKNDPVIDFKKGIKRDSSVDASPRPTADRTMKSTVISTRMSSTKPSTVKSSENTGDAVTGNTVDVTVEEPVLPSSDREIKINCNTVGTMDENPVIQLLDYDFQLPIIADIDDKESGPSAVPTFRPTTKPTKDLMVIPTTEHMVEPTIMPTTERMMEPTIKPTMSPTAKPTAKSTAQLILQPSMIPENVRVNHPGVNNSSFLTPEDHG